MSTGEQRTWTMTVAGGAAILLGALGLAFVALASFVIGVILLVGLGLFVFGDSGPDAGAWPLAGLAILAFGLIVAVFASLDLLFLATGLCIWRVSRRARMFAIASAALAVPMGLLDHWIAFGLRESPGYVACLTLFTPLFALGLVIAIHVIPSWRELLRPLPWKPSPPPSSFPFARS